jgi:hypothetical protein
MVSISEVEKIVDRIRTAEEEKRKISRFLRKIPDLYFKVKPTNLNNLRIGGEDGGLTRKSSHLLDFVFLRAVSVIFCYSNGKLQDVIYYPKTNPTPEMSYSPESLSDIEFRIFWSLQRMKREIKLSIETIKKFSPDLFLVDGSLLINPGDIPKKESSVYSDYLEVKDLLDELYKTSELNDCLLAGVVEDSRSSKFCNFIIDNILNKINNPKIPELINLLEKTRDTNLLYYMLEKGEATKSIELQNGIKCFYLKTVEFDRPIRVEFLRDGEKIASIIYAISSQSRTYGLPNVLIEADQRAKLSESETDYFINLIASKLRLQNIFFLRRESRPF